MNAEIHAASPCSKVVIAVADPCTLPTWDRDVTRFTEATVFHSRGWAKTLVDTYGFRPFYLTARQDKQLVGVFPLVECCSALTGRRGIALPFTDQCDPLADCSTTLSSLLLHAQSLAHERKWRYLELRRSAESPEHATFFAHRTALTSDSEGLFGQIHDSTRRAVKKALKSEVVVSVKTDPGAIDAYYELHCLARKGHGLPPQTRDFFHRVHTELIAQGNGHVVLATLRGRPIAGAVFLFCGQKVIYKFGASDRRFLQFRPNHLVMWTALKHAAEHGFTSFDFGRISLWNEGLRFYKSRWASAEHTLRYSRYSPLTGKWGPVPDGAKGLHTRLFQSLPIPVSRLLGAMLYRHMA